MAAKAIKGKSRKPAVKKAVVKKKAAPARRAKKPKAPSAAVLILSGSTVLRRRKAAETLAETLKVDLFRVDLSAVVNKYIGETEKNLNDVFDKAESSGAILFFDEADALFVKRATAADAHGPYANEVVAHFLQRIESHNGLIILTTNGTQRLDEAFSAKTQVVVMAGTTKTERAQKKK